MILNVGKYIQSAELQLLKLFLCTLVINDFVSTANVAHYCLLQFGNSEAEKARVDTFAAADRSYDVDQKSASSRDGSVANGVGLNSSNSLRSVACFMSET